MRHVKICYGFVSRPHGTDHATDGDAYGTTLCPYFVSVMQVYVLWLNSTFCQKNIEKANMVARPLPLPSIRPRIFANVGNHILSNTCIANCGQTASCSDYWQVDSL